MKLLASLALAGCVCGCGDNIHPAPIDAAEIPDLAVVPSQMTGTETIQMQNFDATSCEVADACVSGIGERRLLAFSTVTANIGTGDLDLGPVPPDGVSSGIFVWSACHMHHHVLGFSTFELLDQTGTVVVVTRKQAFCLEDDEQVTPGHPMQFNCVDQGITVGWADVYAADISCEYLDVTDVPSGTYTVRVAIDPDAMFPDSDRSNNVWVDTVEL